MKQNDIFIKAAEIIPFLVKAEPEKYEKIKAEILEGNKNKSETAQSFIKLMFEIADKKRKAVK